MSEEEISFYEEKIEKQEKHAKQMISITTSSITILLLIVNGMWIFLQGTPNSNFNLILTVYLILPFIAFIITIGFYIAVAFPKIIKYIENKDERIKSLKSIYKEKNSKLVNARITYFFCLFLIITDVAMVSVLLGIS